MFAQCSWQQIKTQIRSRVAANELLELELILGGQSVK